MFAKTVKSLIFALEKQMVIVAQLVRAPDCGSGGRGFEPRLSPLFQPRFIGAFFLEFFKMYSQILIFALTYLKIYGNRL